MTVPLGVTLDKRNGLTFGPPSLVCVDSIPQPQAVQLVNWSRSDLVLLLRTLWGR